MSLLTLFSKLSNINLKLLSYGYVVVIKNGKMGIATRGMLEIIGNKYEKIAFNENKMELNVYLLI